MVKLGRVFSDNAVFQRDSEIAIWGEADAAERISIKLNGKEIMTADLPEGHFVIHLPAQEAMTDATLTVGDAVLKGVDIGEVWVAGGQSNMEFLLKYVKDIDEELQNADDAHLRMYTVGQYSFKGQREAGYKAWNPWDRWIKYGENGTEAFAAVAVFFAKKLRETGVPVGILNCSWGGTKACAWTPTAYMQNEELAFVFDDYKAEIASLDSEKYEKIKNYLWPYRFAAPTPGTPNYNDFIVGHTYNPKKLMAMMGQLMSEGATGTEAENQKAQENQPAQENPMAQIEQLLGGPLNTQDVMAQGPGSEREPGSLYENMVTEIAGYSVRGALWYQGCSDESRGDRYDRMMKAVIDSWRDGWKAVNPAQNRLPFLYVQLAPYGTWMMNRSDNYPKVRESQERVKTLTDDVYMACISDIGNVFDIHPKDKKPVGERLYALAAYYIYRTSENNPESPVGTSMERLAEDTLAICFANAKSLRIEEEDFSSYNGFSLEEIIDIDPGLVPPILGNEKGPKVNGLKVTADGKTLESAEIKTDGNRLLLISDGLKGAKQITVEFAKTGFYQVNLYNEQGLPARPFAF